MVPGRQVRALAPSWTGKEGGKKGEVHTRCTTDEQSRKEEAEEAEAKAAEAASVARESASCFPVGALRVTRLRRQQRV
jgi:hypothetical protein